MTETFKILSQSFPGIDTLTNVYVVPSNTWTQVSSIIVCNQGDTGIVFSVSIAPGSAPDDPSQYIYYNLPLDVADTFSAQLGILMSSGDTIRVIASANLEGGNSTSFSIFGSETTES